MDSDTTKMQNMAKAFFIMLEASELPFIFILLNFESWTVYICYKNAVLKFLVGCSFGDLHGTQWTAGKLALHQLMLLSLYSGALW